MRKNLNKIVFLLVCFIFNNTHIYSLTYGGCEYYQISRLKSIVSNINISYDYYLKDKSAYFDVTVNNITPDIYFIDSKTLNKYTYDNTNNGEITIHGYTGKGGQYKFYSALDMCYGVKLINKYYNFPIYNIYYNEPLCQNNHNFSLCKKWVNVSYSYSELEKLINKYNDNNEEKKEDTTIEFAHKDSYFDKLIRFYIKYYYIILIGIILICISLMIYSRRKNRFDLN